MRTRESKRRKAFESLRDQYELAKRIRDEAVAVKKPLRKWIESFLLDKKVGNRTAQTIRTYDEDLTRFEKAGGDLTPLGVRKYLADLGKRMKPISVHRSYRTLRAFFAWGEKADMFARPEDNPLHGFEMKLPHVEKQAPTDEDVRALLAACKVSKYEGRRNKALVTLLADSALRISEAFQLRWRDVNWAERKLLIHGKGQRDEFGPFGNTAAAALRVWRATQRPETNDMFVFTDRAGLPMRRDYGTHLLHKLSRKAGLKTLVGPHALRRYAACSVLRETGDLNLAQKLLRQRTLAMAQVYAKISNVDVTRKFLANSPMDRLRAGS